MQQYSTDLREGVCRARDAGATRTEVARLFGVSLSSISRWSKAKSETGAAGAKPRRGPQPKLDPAEEAAFVTQVLAHPDATLAEHADRWDAEHGVRLSDATVCRLLARHQITRKKRRWSPASKTPLPGRPGTRTSPSWTLAT